MPEQLENLGIGYFGGLNVRDPADQLAAFSHENGTGAQFAPLQSPSLLNVDFDQAGIRKRKGSTLDKDLAAVLDGNSSTVDADSALGQKVLNVAATTGFKVDGAIIINSGGARQENGVIASIQAGISLTLVVNLTFTHTAVQADAVAQFVLLDGDVVVDARSYTNPATNSRSTLILSKKSIYTDQSGSYRQINDSVSAPYTHNDKLVTKGSIALVDGHRFIGMNGSNKIQVDRGGADLDDELDNGKTYIEAFGGGTQIVTGTWGAAYFKVAGIHDRLVFSDGGSTVQFTDAQQPWDLAGGGNRPARAAVIDMVSHSPQFGDSLNELLYVFTATGVEFMSGFTASDFFKNIEGAPAPLNHRVVISTANWLAYVSAAGGIWGISGNRIIDIGARLNEPAGTSGPLDDINETQAATIAFGFYNERKRQAIWGFPTGASTANDLFVIADFQLGEPIIGELPSQFDNHVRLLKWDGIDYVSIWQTLGQVKGVRSSGKIYDLENGDDDFGSTAIEANYYTPIFTMAAPTISKQWMTTLLRGQVTGGWNVDVTIYLDRSENAEKTWSFSLTSASASLYGTAVYGTGTYSVSGQVKGEDDTNRYSDALQIRFANIAASETFKITNVEQRFMYGAEER